MKVKFDSSDRLGSSLQRQTLHSSCANRTRRKGFIQRLREAAMTIVGSVVPDQWDYLWNWNQTPSWGWPHSHSHSNFNRWREPTRFADRSRTGEIEIPIQIVSTSSHDSRTSEWQEWSDTESDDDFNNSSKDTMKSKRRKSQPVVKTSISNDLQRKGSISTPETSSDEDLKRKQSTSGNVCQNTRRYPTRSSGMVHDIPVLIRSDSEEKEINDTCSYSVYEYLKAFLASSGRQIDSIKGDGNCFFRALSKQIYGNQNFYDDVRQAVVDVLAKHPKKFEAFTDGPITKHVEEMRKDKTWATQTEIYAAATLLNRDIYILSPDQTGDTYRWLLFQPQVKYNSNHTGCKCYITICHTHGNHYDRIAPIKGKCNCELKPPVMTGVKGEVDLTFEDEIV